MPATPPPRRGLSTRQFAWIFGVLLLLITIFQMARHQPQHFEPPPNGTSAEITDPDRPAPPVRDARVYTNVSEMPEPPGGLPGLRRYLAQHLRCPAGTAPTDTLRVSFIVRPDGRLADVDAGNGGCAAEVARVLSEMPPWQPGRQQGQPVNVAYTLPLAFPLQ